MVLQNSVPWSDNKQLSYKHFTIVFALLSFTLYVLTKCEKWSITTNIFCTTGFFLVSTVTSILTKLMCMRSIGSVEVMLHSGTFGSFFSYTLHFSQFCRVIIICVLIFGHQNRSCNNEYVVSLPCVPCNDDTSLAPLGTCKQAP